METEGVYTSVCARVCMYVCVCVCVTRMSICIACMAQVKRESKRFCDNAAKMLSIDPEALVGIWVRARVFVCIACVFAYVHVHICVSMWMRGDANMCACVC